MAIGSVTFNRVWITLASDPTVAITGGSNGRSDIQSLEGEFRAYAGGRMRLISGPTRQRQLQATLVISSAAQAALFNSMLGKLVLFRDSYGRRMFGAFLSTQAVDFPLSGGFVNVGVTVSNVTVDENAL